ncbi:hypothetical protein LTR94_031230, partial [Friedmanniomyces endolithicus]
VARRGHPATGAATGQRGYPGLHRPGHRRLAQGGLRLHREDAAVGPHRPQGRRHRRAPRRRRAEQGRGRSRASAAPSLRRLRGRLHRAPERRPGFPGQGGRRQALPARGRDPQRLSRFAVGRAEGLAQARPGKRRFQPAPPHRRHGRLDRQGAQRRPGLAPVAAREPGGGRARRGAGVRGLPDAPHRRH